MDLTLKGEDKGIGTFGLMKIIAMIRFNKIKHINNSDKSHKPVIKLILLLQDSVSPYMPMAHDM